MTLDELKTRLTIPLWPEAGQLLGISKNSTYRAAASGEIPTLRLNSRYVVPTHLLLKMCGVDPAAEQSPAEQP